MATRAIFLPESASMPSATFAPITEVNARKVIRFDAATAWTCYWTGIAPVGLTGALTVVGHYMMASATTGKVDFTVAVEAVTPGDSTDLDAGTSFATVNTITAPTVPGTAGYLGSFTCTLTNDDSMAAGDYFRIALTRDATDGTNDTASGDCYVVAVEFKDAA